MAGITSYLGLTKPEIGDRIDPGIFSDNFEKIDGAFVNKADKTDVDALQVNVDTLSSDVKVLTRTVEDLILQINNISSLLDDINGEVR